MRRGKGAGRPCMARCDPKTRNCVQDISISMSVDDVVCLACVSAGRLCGEVGLL